MLPLYELTQSIAKYPKHQLIKMVIDQCWSVFLDKELELEKDIPYRHFTTCATWICFIAISNNKDTNIVNEELTEEKLLEVSDQTWKFLDYQDNALSSHKKWLEWLKFKQLLKPALSEFFKDNEKNQTDKKKDTLQSLIKISLSPLMSCLNDSNLEPPFGFKIQQNIYAGENIRRKNPDIDIKYSGLPVIRSLLIYQKLESNNLEIYGLSALKFHQILSLITKIAIKHRGAFSETELRVTIK